jgi:hypothetical protein
MIILVDADFQIGKQLFLASWWHYAHRKGLAWTICRLFWTIFSPVKQQVQAMPGRGLGKFCADKA